MHWEYNQLKRPTLLILTNSKESIGLNEQKFCIHHAKNGDCHFDEKQLLKAIK